MASIEPGIYRIVNAGRGTAITVSADNTSTIVGWETNHPGQQWIVRRSEGKYHISDSAHRRYVTVNREKEEAKVSLGSHPTSWEIIPAKDSTWSFKRPEHDLVIDMDGAGNGQEVRLQNTIRNYNDSRWRLERLGDLPNNEPNPDLSGVAEKARMVTQMVEQLAQQGKQFVELAGQLADQNQRNSDQNQRIADLNQRIADQNQKIADQNQKIVDQNQKLTDQEREIYTLKREIEEKDQQLDQANKEVKFVLARATQGQEPPHQCRTAGTARSNTSGTGQGEDSSLRDEVERLKGRMNMLIQGFTL